MDHITEFIDEYMYPEISTAKSYIFLILMLSYIAYYTDTVNPCNWLNICEISVVICYKCFLFHSYIIAYSDEH